MPTVLEQLRAAQRDAGLVVPEHPETEVVVPGMKPAKCPIIKAVEAAAPGAVIACSPLALIQPGAGGYIKIFPPTFQSLRDIPAEWVEANWNAPSPWCRVEGQPDHPEFEANLAGVER